MLNSSDNTVKIEGILSEVSLKTGSYQKNGVEVENINGSIKVRVNQKINGMDTELDIPVYLFANKLKNNGQPNPAYTSIEHIKDFNSIAVVGIEQADRVRITGANIRMNEYYTPAGQLVSYPRIHASFVNKLTNLKGYSPEASFTATVMIGSMGYEVDKEGVEIENRYRVRGVLPQYGGSVDVVDFLAISPNVINGVSSIWSQGDTVKVVGKLNFTSRVEEKEVAVDFGEPTVEKHTVSVSELVITGGANPLEGDFAFDADEVKTALEERQNRLNDLKDKAKNKAKAPAASKKPSFNDLGF